MKNVETPGPYPTTGREGSVDPISTGLAPFGERAVNSNQFSAMPCPSLARSGLDFPSNENSTYLIDIPH
jgi:hypothetical protein